jgi:hypothetical protein
MWARSVHSVPPRMEARQAATAGETGRSRANRAVPAPRNPSSRSDEKNDDGGRDEANLHARWRDIVERQPVLAVSGAVAVGAALGGVVFWRLGRLAFLVVAGYVANELWHSEQRIEIDELISKLSSPRRGGGSVRGGQGPAP